MQNNQSSKDLRVEFFDYSIIGLLILMNDPVSDFKTWYFKHPAFSRTFVAASFIIVCLYSFKFIGFQYLVYDPTLVIARLQIWRLFTSFLFFGGFSFNYLFAMYFAYFAMSRVETDLFDKKTYADFYWLIIYLWGFNLLAASFLGLFLIGQPFVFALLYIWCKRRPTETITFYFGFRVKSACFPLVYMAFNILMGQSFTGYLVGLFLGHLYIHIKDVLTVKYGKDYLATPGFFKNFVKRYITKQIRGNGYGAREQDDPERQAFRGNGVRIG